MITPFHINVWFTCVLCALNHILGVSSVEIGATLPPKVEDVLKNTNISEVKNLLNNSRRILGGSQATNSRPYMVYLKLPSNSVKFNDYRRWLCGGVIVHEEFILTSAACIEDVKHFYVVSGTYKHSEQFDRYNNMCIKNGARKAVWKCIPKNYIFDGHENDNIRWMNNDIAVVKVDEEFDFTRRVRGCDFVPKPICYNNMTVQYEKPGTQASVAGWGSTEKYNDWVNSRRQEEGTQDLLEAGVVLISKPHCKKRWGRRYHNIIDNYMVCSMDLQSDPSELCLEKYVDCTDIMYSDEEDARRVLDPKHLRLHSAYHNESEQDLQFRRQATGNNGGFCENDHGGPLVYGTGTSSIVIGIISACLVKERTNRCYGPFLYTSVYKNKVLINCAIYKDVGNECNKLFRSSETHTEVVMSWVDHPDGPAKNEIKKMRRTEELKNATLNSTLGNLTKPAVTADAKPSDVATTVKAIETNTSASQPVKVHKKISVDDDDNSTHVEDKPLQHIGLILRTYEEKPEAQEPTVNKTAT